MATAKTYRETARRLREKADRILGEANADAKQLRKEARWYDTKAAKLEKSEAE